jgi:hypothetical protein
MITLTKGKEFTASDKTRLSGFVGACKIRSPVFSDEAKRSQDIDSFQDKYDINILSAESTPYIMKAKTSCQTKKRQRFSLMCMSGRDRYNDGKAGHRPDGLCDEHQVITEETADG